MSRAAVSLAGPWRGERHGARDWRLQRAHPEALVMLRGVDPDVMQALCAVTLQRVDIEWHDGWVQLTLTGPAGAAAARARGAVIHEPLPALYGCLALPAFDAKARRFWRNVFRLVRIPGGRALLRVLARRA